MPKKKFYDTEYTMDKEVLPGYTLKQLHCWHTVKDGRIALGRISEDGHEVKCAICKLQFNLDYPKTAIDMIEHEKMCRLLKHNEDRVKEEFRRMQEEIDHASIPEPQQIIVHKIYKPAKRKRWQTFKNRRRPQYTKYSAAIQNPAFLPYYPPVPGCYGHIPGYLGAGYGGMGCSGPGYVWRY